MKSFITALCLNSGVVLSVISERRPTQAADFFGMRLRLSSRQWQTVRISCPGENRASAWWWKELWRWAEFLSFGPCHLQPASETFSRKKLQGEKAPSLLIYSKAVEAPSPPVRSLLTVLHSCQIIAVDITKEAMTYLYNPECSCRGGLRTGLQQRATLQAKHLWREVKLPWGCLPTECVPKLPLESLKKNSMLCFLIGPPDATAQIRMKKNLNVVLDWSPSMVEAMQRLEGTLYRKKWVVCLRLQGTR